MLACYIMTIIFLLPYLLAVFLYLMDISYLSGEIDLRGDISEPEVPEGTTDLSNVSLRDLCGACLAAPCLICIQLSALLECCKCCCHLCKKDDRSKRRRQRKKAAARQEEEGAPGFFANLFNMIRSVCHPCTCTCPTPPVSSSFSACCAVLLHGVYSTTLSLCDAFHSLPCLSACLVCLPCLPASCLSSHCCRNKYPSH